MAEVHKDSTRSARRLPGTGEWGIFFRCPGESLIKRKMIAWYWMEVGEAGEVVVVACLLPRASACRRCINTCRMSHTSSTATAGNWRVHGRRALEINLRNHSRQNQRKIAFFSRSTAVRGVDQGTIDGLTMGNCLPPNRPILCWLEGKKRD